jgi:hypothetical protein
VSTLLSALCAAPRPVRPSRYTGQTYPDAAVQWRLWLVLLAGLMGIAASFWFENLLLPWKSRMDRTTPGWAFVLSQASVFGFVSALTFRGRSASIAQALLAATLIGYAYVIAGSALIDPRRSVQYAHLIVRAVELGLVSVAAMIVGATIRLLARQRFALHGDDAQRHAAQFSLGDLMFLTLVFAIGVWLVNLFFDHFEREAQLGDVLLSVVRALPAALPWLWGVTQPRLSYKAVLGIVASSAILWAIKTVCEYETMADELLPVMVQVGVRSVANAAGASATGLLLRGLGFRWCFA